MWSILVTSMMDGFGVLQVWKDQWLRGFPKDANIFLSGCYRYDLNHQLYNFFSNSFGLANLILHVCDLSHGGEDTHEDTWRIRAVMFHMLSLILEWQKPSKSPLTTPQWDLNHGFARQKPKKPLKKALSILNCWWSICFSSITCWFEKKPLTIRCIDHKHPALSINIHCPPVIKHGLLENPATKTPHFYLGKK